MTLLEAAPVVDPSSASGVYSLMWVVIALRSAHSPQAMEVAGSPRALRAWANASRKAFAAP